MVKKSKKVKAKKEDIVYETPVVPEKPEEPDKPVKEVKEPVKETIAEKAKILSKGGLTTKEVGLALGINKYEASKLIKE